MFVLPPAPASSVLYLPFDTYAADGSSVTITGLAVTDIEIYKNGSVTQRASDNGYTLLDTDGIDFDGVTGLHGFSIDLADNSDSGFYAAGGQYWVNVNAITCDSVTVRFTYYFRIVAAENTAGTPAVDTVRVSGTAQTARDLGGTLGAAGAGLTAIVWNAAWDAEVQSEVDDALVAQRLDELLATDSDIDGAQPPTVGSVFHEVLSKTAGSFTFDQTTDSLEALRDNTGTAGVGLTAVVWNASWDAEVQSEVQDAIEVNQLDHLIAVANPGGNVVNSSLWAALVSKSATPAYSSYDNTTDSLEANRDNIGTAGAGLTAADDAVITAIAAVQADLPQRITKNVELVAFPFFMELSSDNVSAATGMTVTATRSIDGGAFAACANSVTEIGSGWYKITLAAADLNGNTIALKFSATGANTVNVTIITEPT